MIQSHHNEVTHKINDYVLQQEQIISLNDIKNNKSFIFKDVLEKSPNKEMVDCEINVFEFIKGDIIEYKTNSEIHTEINTKSSIKTPQKTILIKPIPLINNATISKEDDTIIITFTYIYDQKYRYKTVNLSNLYFDYFVTLTSNTYQGLYHFENKYGKFRIDLEICFN